MNSYNRNKTQLRIMKKLAFVINKEQFLEAKKFLDSLEDHDDVQKVYSNLEILE